MQASLIVYLPRSETMLINLKNLAAGDFGKIVGFDKAGKAYRKRLLAMGLTPGTEFSVTRFAPMGDPVADVYC